MTTTHSAHVATFRRGEYKCAECKKPVVPCSCTNPDQEKEPNQYCNYCHGTGWVLKQ